MYHSGSPGDLLVVVLAVVIFIFWIGVWALHCISIMYGKWRLHRSTTVQIPGRASTRIRPNQAKDYAAVCDGESSHNEIVVGDDPDQKVWTYTNSTIIQVETDGDQRNFTLFSGGLLPGVSILKPLVGVDQYLMQNLESFFTMAYPKFELLFCVPDESDPAIMVVQSLMNKYPTVDARIFIGGENVGVNPKINNMMPGYRASQYDLLLVSDSAIMMRDDTLLDMVFTMLLPDLDRDQPKSWLRRLWDFIRNRGPTHGVGLVHQMPFSMDREEFGFPACLEKVYFGSAHARIYLAADCLGINCPTGMSALMRKKVLENKGGMGVFGRYLAEDYFFAKAMTDQGWRICISSQPAWQNSAVCHLAHFQDRLERWAKLRFAMVPLATLLEPLQECFLLGILASMAISFLFDLSALGVFLVHIITWFLLDWTLLKTVQCGRLSYSKLDFIISWLFRECTCTIMFVKSLLNPRIQWKNGYYRLKWGGLAEIIKSPECPGLELPLVATVSSVDQISLQCHQMGVAKQSSSIDLRQLLPSSALDVSATKSSRSLSRHVRSRSLPQKNPMASLLQTFTSKVLPKPNAVLYSCDDLVTNNFPFRGKNEGDIF